MQNRGEDLCAAFLGHRANFNCDVALIDGCVHGKQWFKLTHRYAPLAFKVLFKSVLFFLAMTLAFTNTLTFPFTFEISDRT